MEEKPEVIIILEKLIDYTRGLSEEDFAKREVQLEIDKIIFDPRKYGGD